MSKLPISPHELDNVKQEINKCQEEKIARGKELGAIMSTSGSFSAKTPGYTETENVIRVLDAKIEQLTQILASTMPIRGIEELSIDRIGVYSRVTAEDNLGNSKKYYICHLPGIRNSKEFIAVTPRSPVGKSLLGKSSGDEIEIILPRGKTEVTIISHEIEI